MSGDQRASEPSPPVSAAGSLSRDRSRLLGLDAARGLAMFLVCLSHFGDVYLDPLGLERVDAALNQLTLAATPTFILVSGLVLGFLHSSHPDFDRLRRKLLDRALFLLTIAHVAIAVAHLPRFGPGGAFDIIFVTDVVAVCVITGTLLVPVVGARARASLGVGLYVAATLLVLGWRPHPESAAHMAKDFLVGHRPLMEESAFAYNFPVLPWLGLYLVSTALGQTLARSRTRGDGIAVLTRIGAVLAVLGVALRALQPTLRHLWAVSPGVGGSGADFLTSRWQKLPPGPTYMLFYTGLALWLVAGSLWLDRVTPHGALPGLLRIVGRNSLVVFVLQYYVYYGLTYALHLHHSVLWPLLFAATFLFLALAAWAWQRIDGARFLTVGYPGLVAWAEGFGRERTAPPRLSGPGPAGPAR